MPIQVLTSAEEKAGVEQLNPAFRLLLAEAGVPVAIQGVLGHSRVTTYEMYAKLEPDEPSLRRWLRASGGFGLDEDTLENRVQVSALLIAWDACRDRITRRSALESEHRAAGRAPTLLRGDVLSLRRAYETVHGELIDEDAPGKGYIELKIENIHDGELVAENLTEVTSVAEEGKTPVPGVGVDVRWDQVLQLKTGRHSVAAPRSPEELRHRLQLMRVMWGYISLKGIAPQMLAQYDGTVWDEYAKYLLGPEGWALETKGAEGEIIASPSWAGLLVWEFQIRKAAVKLVNNGKASLTEALRTSMREPKVYMRYFLQPISVSAGAAAASRARSGGMSWPGEVETGYEPAAKRFRGEGGKGGGKDKGRGKGKGKDSSRGKGGDKSGSGPAVSKPHPSLRKQRSSHPDTLTLRQGDKKVCFDHQTVAGCKRDKCAFLHSCAHCGQTGHGYEDCAKVKRP